MKLNVNFLIINHLHGIGIYIRWPYTSAQLEHSRFYSCAEVPDDLFRTQPMPTISIFNHNCAVIIRYVLLEKCLFWKSISLAWGFIIHCCRRQQEQANHMGDQITANCFILVAEYLFSVFPVGFSRFWISIASAVLWRVLFKICERQNVET
jgi:hypothetical protein